MLLSFCIPWSLDILGSLHRWWWKLSRYGKKNSHACRNCAFYMDHIPVPNSICSAILSSFWSRELVIDLEQIANRYLKWGCFIIDILSILPLPQIALIQFFIHSKGVQETKVALLIIVLIQFVPRLLQILPFASELKKTVGVFVESDFFGAISYLMFFMLLSHIVGSFWYLLAVQRNIDCWEKACKAPGKCEVEYLYCSTNTIQNSFPESWTSISESFLNNACSVKNDESTTEGVVRFGIYKQAVLSGIFSRQKFFFEIHLLFVAGTAEFEHSGAGNPNQHVHWRNWVFYIYCGFWPSVLRSVDWEHADLPADSES